MVHKFYLKRANSATGIWCIGSCLRLSDSFCNARTPLLLVSFFFISRASPEIHALNLRLDSSPPPVPPEEDAVSDAMDAEEADAERSKFMSSPNDGGAREHSNTNEPRCKKVNKI